ncbi:hypothetical protein [uncultured Brevundimonas sp.]|uniref:hypothetical protein n=1 Tax=uncultured Brevundimonas sp. TaxID=213418 RepID=UPI00261282B7|nr:hypothetical protein [uncultured Brevundimonas sp.]
MARHRTPLYARKPKAPEQILPSPVCSAGGKVVIGRDHQGIVFGSCLADLVLIHDHHQQREERIVVSNECFE